MFPVVVALAVALFLVGCALLLLGALAGRRTQRLEARVTGLKMVGDDVEGYGAVVSRMALAGRRVEQWMDTQDETARLFVQAGWRTPQSRVAFYATQAALPVLAVIGAFVLWLGGAGWSITQFAMALFVALAIALLLPKQLLKSVAQRRCRAIRHEVPMFIHLLMLLFEAGLSTRQALQSLIREARGVLPVLNDEMQLVLRQIEAGGDTAQVLKQLGAALDVGELETVLSILRQDDRYGGELREPLAEALTVMEERRVFEMREAVNRLSGRMTVVMVLCFLPALLIFVAGPPFVSIFRVLGATQ